jgi:dienelactone hydrolase
VVAAEDCRGFRHETWAYGGSAGDRILAEAWLSADPGPVVVAGHGADGDRNAQYIRGGAKAWARRGFSVVAADAPLHGARSEGRPPPEINDPERAGFIDRAARDVVCLADAVAARLGPGRPLGYLGFSMGTHYGVPAVAADGRFRSAAFAVGGLPAGSAAGPGVGADALEASTAADPRRWAAAVAPRPVLMVNADADEVFTRDAALALYDAFRPPKEIVFFPGTHTVWRSPAQWYRRIERFLRDTL